MPALSAAQQRKRRIAPHDIDVYLVLLKPTIVFRALVNMASVTYPTASITFDNVTVGAYTAIKPGMTIRIGSATKKSDYGSTYVRAAATSTTIPIGWSSQGRERPGEVDLVDNAYIEVLDMREIWMETPRILDDDSATIYKKYDIAFSPTSPPVAYAGPDYAEFVSGGAINVLFSDVPGQAAPDDFASFATAPGASIASRAWDFIDGTPSSDSTSTPGSVSFPAGYRYISLTATDSNGESHTAYSLIVGCEQSGANAPITNFQITSHRHAIEGQTIQFRVNDELDSADYPPGTRVLIFARERFGRFSKRTGTRNNSAVITGIDTTDLYEGMPVTGDGVPYGATITTIDSATQLTLTQVVNGTGSVELAIRTKQARLIGPTGRSQMLFSGWLTDEDNELAWSERGLQRGLTFTAVDAAGRLAQLPGFPQEVRRKSSPTKWGEMREANIPRYVHYLLHWHSNVFSLTGFKWAGEDYNFSWLSSDGATLYEQANQRAEAMAGRLGCDAFGRLMLSFDPQLQTESDRTAVETVDILNSDWKSLRWKFTQPPRNYWLKGAALLTSTAESDADDPYPVYARAPGFAPGQGPSAADQNYQLVRTTDEEWDREGQRYATKLNAKNGAWGISLVHGAYCGIDPIRMEWARLRVADANKSLRGRSFPSGKRFLPIEVNYSYDHTNGVVYQEVSAEEEVIGLRAVDDPPPQSSPNPYGDGGPPIWDVIGPLPDLPGIGIGDFGYTPALPMPISPLPGQPDQYGKAFGATAEGFVFQATWPAGTLTFTDKSPTSVQRANIGTCIGLRRDARNYKKYWLYGSKGLLSTNDITKAAPTWFAVRSLAPDMTDTDNMDGTHTLTINFGSSTGGFNLDRHVGIVPFAGSMKPDGQGFDYVAGQGWRTPNIETRENLGYYRHRMALGRTIQKPITVREVKFNWTSSGVTTHNVQASIFINSTQYPNGYSINVPRMTGTGTISFSPLDYVDFVVGDVLGFWLVDEPNDGCAPCISVMNSMEITYEDAEPPFTASDETQIGDFQGCINRKDAYYWLSVKPVSGTDYVYLNSTFDNFLTLNSTKVAKYVANINYGFTVSSFNYRKIWVAAGDPADSSAALYSSADGGATFAKTSAALNVHGGACWMNYSKADKTKNTTDSSLMWIRGRDGSDNFQFVVGAAGTPITVINSATKKLITPAAFGAIARDLDFVRIAFNDGKFYVSSNAGTTWAASVTDIPAGGDVYGWSQFPADSAFAFAFGDQTLAFTTDAGATWEDMWTDYDTFRSGEYGSDGTIVVTLLPDLSVRYPIPIGGS